MTDTTTPMIPTSDWIASVKATYWGVPARNPYLIPLTEIAETIGIKRESMSSNVSARPEWFPFVAVTIGRAPKGGQPTQYYRRSDVEPWINQYRIRNELERGASDRNGSEWYRETCKPRTDDMTAVQRYEATMRELWALRTGQEVSE